MDVRAAGELFAGGQPEPVDEPAVAPVGARSRLHPSRVGAEGREGDAAVFRGGDRGRALFGQVGGELGEGLPWRGRDLDLLALQLLLDALVRGVDHVVREPARRSGAGVDDQEFFLDADRAHGARVWSQRCLERVAKNAATAATTTRSRRSFMS
nr:hypothetical protein [Sporichthya polymorpha]